MTEISALEIDGGARDVVVVGNLAYVASTWNGLRIINVADSTHPIEIGSLHNQVGYWGVEVVGNYAFLVSESAGLSIVDISDSYHPRVIGLYETQGVAHDTAVAGHYVYLADGRGGLDVVDVERPDFPFSVGFFDIPGEAIRVTVKENFAYVASLSGGVTVLDITFPSFPKEVGYYRSSTSAVANLAVDGDIIYACDEVFGLIVLGHYGPHTISGQVTMPGGLPLPGVWVFAGPRHAITGDDGRYRLTRLQPGEYDLFPVLAGYNFVPPLQKITVPPEGTNVAFAAEAWPATWTTAMPVIATCHPDSLWWMK